MEMHSTNQINGVVHLLVSMQPPVAWFKIENVFDNEHEPFETICVYWLHLGTLTFKMLNIHKKFLLPYSSRKTWNYLILRSYNNINKIQKQSFLKKKYLEIKLYLYLFLCLLYSILWINSNKFAEKHSFC